jgi:hypothetical protein
MRLYLYALSTIFGGVGVFLVYLSCHAPAVAPRALLMLGTACVLTRFTAPQ